MELVNKLNLTKKYLESEIDDWPKSAIILGSGLKDIVNQFRIYRKFNFRDIPFAPTSTLQHMDPSLYLIRNQNSWCWLVGGRVHYYEGYKLDEIVYTVRFLAYCGVEKFLLTNAAGSVNPEYDEGSLVLVKDHINWSLPSPLIGKNEPVLGTRFPEMIHAYDDRANKAITEFCNHNHISISEGIYLGLSGPQLETPSEYRLFRNIGADIVGMSTIPEVIAINHMGRKCSCVSVVSNNASNPDNIKPVSMDELLTNITSRTNDLKKIIEYWINI